MRTQRSSSKSSGGFALITTLLILILLVLLVTGLLSLSSITLRASSQSKHLEESRANARMALMLALAELQKTAGPDQRVTATADILNDSDASKASTVGVWATSDSAIGAHSKGDLLRWLTSDAVDHNQQPTKDHHTEKEPDDGVTLLGSGSLASSEGRVVVDLSNSTITANDLVSGRYAWWIGDEGVKARIDLHRPQTDGALAAKQRSVLEVGGSSTNTPGLLPGLTEIDFDEDAQRLVDLSTLELVSGGRAGLDKQYFRHLTTLSTGVLSDVSQGGLKKDLSLAFEMSDADFDASALADNGPSAIGALGYGRGKVQPVFELDAEGATAIGPVWNLLRQYYRLYQLVEDPMTNPTLTAQAVGPSLGHRNPALHDTSDGYLEKSDNNNIWGKQPAVKWGGGPALTWSLSVGNEVFGNGWKDALGARNTSLGPSGAIAKTYAASELPMTMENGDPLRKDSGLPVMVESSYAPYLLRAIKTDGIALKEESDTEFRMYLSSRDMFSIHNPYNVTLSHPDLSLELITLYPSFRNSVTEKVVKANNGGAMSRTYISSSSMAPGEINQYNGNQLWQKKYANEYDKSPEWHGTKFGYQGIGGLLSKEDYKTFTLTPYVGSLTQGNQYSFSSLNVISAMRGSNGFSVESGNHMNRPSGGRWPITSVVSTTIVSQGSNYGGDKAGSDYRQEGLSPVNIRLSDNLIKGNIEGNPDDIVPLITYDFQLRPAEFETLSSSTSARYPTYALTNPMAPVKDNKNLLPLDDLLKNSFGFAKFAPGWELTLTSMGGNNQPLTDYDFWGPTDGDTFTPNVGVSRPVLLEIPTTPLQSLGQLQHANITVHAHMPALAISNSLASPYIPRSQTYNVFKNRHDHDRIFYDVSYLMNEALWDGYFFSSYSARYDEQQDQYGTGPTDEFNAGAQEVGKIFDEAFDPALAGSLPNRRMKLVTHFAETHEDIKDKLFNDSDTPREDSYLRSAENLMVHGAFNINSTSVDAWRAVLSGAREQDVYRAQSTSPETLSEKTPFTRLSQPLLGEGDDDSASDATWSGFRALTDDELSELAQAIVDEIKIRANDTTPDTRSAARPFISLAEFVNRELTTSEIGLCGLLQAAIDRTGLNAGLSDYGEVSSKHLSSAATGAFPHPENIDTVGEAPRTGGMVAPTYLMQADILQVIGSFISVRSDTFRIRAYGESLDRAGVVRSRTWCEAVVQRTPTPVMTQAGTTPRDASYWSGKDASDKPYPFGRKFQITSFKWLSEDEV